MTTHIRRRHHDYDRSPSEPRRVTRSSGLYAKSTVTPPASSPSECGGVESPNTPTYQLLSSEKINLVRDYTTSQNVIANKYRSVSQIVSLYIHLSCLYNLISASRWISPSPLWKKSSELVYRLKLPTTRELINHSHFTAARLPPSFRLLIENRLKRPK